jgi:hypothetical protein
MKIKDYLFITIILLLISVLFVPIDRKAYAVWIIVLAVVLSIVYWFVKKK